MNLSAEIAALFARRGAEAYFGEQVSMLEHGLQAAHFASIDGASPSLVVAALLHDVGHLLEAVPDDIADWRQDAQHEAVGSAWLARHFDADVWEPVALHVAAKRYLCATDPAYHAQLSSASVHTLRLQGGPMPAAEVSAFERHGFFREAVRLRRWDDRGKIAGFATQGLDHYLALIEAVRSDAARDA